MLNQVYEPLIGLILPELCQRCGRAGGGGFCGQCQDEFLHNDAACRICGCGPLPTGQRSCLGHPAGWQIAHVVAPLIYAAPAQDYLHALKYSGERPLGRAFGQLLAAEAAPRRRRVDAIISVPLHSRRLIRRGYNQALEIARAVASMLHMPILRTGITRTHDTAPQVTLDTAARRSNLAGAFTIARSLQGLRVAIVDDVITTGATVNTLAGAVLDAGATHVEAWVVARTPPPALYGGVSSEHYGSAGTTCGARKT